MNEQSKTRIIRLPEVMNLVGLKKTTIYMKIREGSFPKPIKLGARATGWEENVIQEWINQQIQSQRSAA